MINLRFFNTIKRKEPELSKEELIHKIELELSSLQVYSIQVLENITIYEKRLAETNIKLDDLKKQSECALFKNNKRLYNKSLTKISDNESAVIYLSKTILDLKTKLQLAITDIRYLEESLEGL